ncbi:ethanolamine ammonia-lyase subunit EutC [Rhodoplanes sp. Z2-YC6860]|uniref:ethanolamine ammonia-lyase subunit EutC n=1 Tax=Rhodoplanes sp. Z2-YC6860 TaxID=674703 RepID=UPI00078DA1E0|nr:ethanolamine ammonia-lyase subunit EutC [Rhodoplanes sp. Z2-YC6860]AMN39358.1 ethanolamine ammonia-lyase small subunit [Rhodoplanes sp. Z2-YC6860]
MADEPTKQDRSLWDDLRRLSGARIGLPRAGASLATGPLLDFKLAHARARDAVHDELDTKQLATDLAPLGIDVITIDSAAEDRQRYLMRPDLGRKLAPDGEAKLAPRAARHDAVFVIADGLSARAVQRHAQPVLTGTIKALRAEGWRIGPLVIVRHGRVAVGDAIASLLGSDSVAVLIGERPGLTAPDSMGAYLTWQPHPGTTDADRNCISNIRPDGIPYADAEFKLAHLLRAMRARRISGVSLKDDSDQAQVQATITNKTRDAGSKP